MIQEPKLLTEAEAVELFSLKYSQVERVLATLRERGLIAPEPVDPLLLEAREIVAAWWERNPSKFPTSKYTPARYRKGDKDPKVEQALAALRRGMEIAALRAKQEQSS